MYSPDGLTKKFPHHERPGVALPVAIARPAADRGGLHRDFVGTGEVGLHPQQMVFDRHAVGRDVAETLLRHLAAIERHQHLAAGGGLDQIPDTHRRGLGRRVERLQRDPLRIAGVFDRSDRCGHVPFVAERIGGRAKPLPQFQLDVAVGPGQVQAHRTRQFHPAAGLRQRVIAHVQRPRLPVLVGTGVGKEGVQFRHDPGAVAARVMPTAAGKQRAAVSASSNGGLVQKKFSSLSARTSSTPAPRKGAATGGCRRA